MDDVDPRLRVTAWVPPVPGIAEVFHAQIGPAADHTNLVDPVLGSLLAGIHRSLTAGEEPLDAEARLALIGRHLRSRLSTSPIATEPVEATVARLLRDLLDAHLTRPPSLAEAARLFDRSPSHLVRSFTREVGVSPHAYVIGRRIDLARRRLLRGDPPAAVALDLGFYDQAHFTRHFRRHTSTTPGRFAAPRQQVLRIRP